jgi:DNA-binding MarR family transcriptional regulator
MSTYLGRRDLARLMMPTWRALLEIETRRCAENDLPHWQYIILADVQEHPGTSQKHIAQRIVRSPSRLATDVEGLRSRGLLQRTSATQDRRINRLSLTDDGQALTRHVRGLIHIDEDHLLQRLAVAERAQLRDLLTRALDPEAM